MVNMFFLPFEVRRRTKFPTQRRILVNPEFTVLNSRAFHHMAEVLKQRIELKTLYNQKKAKLGYKASEGSYLADAAEKDARLRKLFNDRDAAIVSSLKQIAGIKSRGKRALAVEAFRKAREDSRHWTIENGAVGEKVWADLGIRKRPVFLTAKELVALRLAYHDWVHAPMYFSKGVEPAF